jgi:hypothetical protein
LKLFQSLLNGSYASSRNVKPHFTQSRAVFWFHTGERDVFQSKPCGSQISAEVGGGVECVLVQPVLGVRVAVKSALNPEFKGQCLSGANFHFTGKNFGSQ